MKQPLIGVTAGLTDSEEYMTIYRQCMDGLLAAGMLPVLLPVTEDEAILSRYTDALDGFLFSGGVDVDPLRFGQQQHAACGAISPLRDANELALARLLIQRGDKPVLGICRGFQVLNIALGGDIYQDLEACRGGELINHRQKQPETYVSHSVTLTPGSRLHRIIGTEELMVNSLHHQGIRRLGEGFIQTAAAPDGVIEGAELEGHPFFIGVQWHPERLWWKGAEHMALFRALAAASPVIVLTDSDGAGKVIRNFIHSALPRDKVIDVYTPAVFGQEKRKKTPSREGKLGVEGFSPAQLAELLAPYATESGARGALDRAAENPLNKTDFYFDGLSGGANSASRRDALAAALALPPGMSASALLSAVRLLCSYAEYKRLVAELFGGDQDADA